MAKKMLIDATHPEETRVVVLDGNKVEEFDFESQQRRQLAGNIYLAKVTRVEPSLQAAFVDYGGNRHGFLAFSEIHPDYYQIPVADREALMEEERAYAEAMAAQAEAEDAEREKKPKRRRRPSTKAAKAETGDAVATKEIEGGIDGMETVDVQEPGDAVSLETTEAEAQVAVAVEAEDTAVTAEEADAPVAAQAAPEPETATAEDNTPEAETEEDDHDPKGDIESVAEEDESEEIRPVRKPRLKRYRIQEVVKVRQIMLVQVVKEERGNKGAALTTYLSLAGRYCVLMPNTARGGGISRKITNIADRKKLKDIANTIEVPQGAGLIVRTAGAKRTKAEIKRDYEYLQRMWEQIRARTLESTAPALIYEEGDLIKRSIRDLYNRDIDEVIVAGDAGYRNAKDTMKMIMPSHAKNVKPYSDAMALFARYQVEDFLDGMFSPTVQLKSGGYLVIGVTEALVAVDVNSGRATKEGSIEQTALTTNLEAAEEVARQLRLRDLAGLIVIDFIDMDERRNNIAVEKRLKDKLKTDRARIQVGRISGFGLMEMSRQRLRPGMLEASTQQCPHCHGTGLIRSDDSIGLTILREVEQEGARRRTKEILVKAPMAVANFLINQKRESIMALETRHGMSIRVEADPFLISPDYTLERFKTATRVVPQPVAAVSSVDVALMEEIDEAIVDDPTEDPVHDAVDDEEAPKKKRKRRRRRKSGAGDAQDAGETPSTTDMDEGGETNIVAVPEDAAEDDEKPKRKRRTRGGRGRKKDDAAEVTEVSTATEESAPAPEAEEPQPVESEPEAPEPEAEEAPKKKRKPRKKKEDAPAEEPVAEEPKATEPVANEAPAPEAPAPETPAI